MPSPAFGEGLKVFEITRSRNLNFAGKRTDAWRMG